MTYPMFKEGFPKVMGDVAAAYRGRLAELNRQRPLLLGA